MVTVGLIKELYFIAVMTHAPQLDFFIGHPDAGAVFIRIEGGQVEIRYKSHLIWKETIEGDLSFFGVESCDTISRIIACLDNNDPEGAKRLFYIQNSP